MTGFVQGSEKASPEVVRLALQSEREEEEVRHEMGPRLGGEPPVGVMRTSKPRFATASSRNRKAACEAHT